MSILADVKIAFQRKDNVLVKLILINVIIYVVDALLWLFSKAIHPDIFLIYKWQMMPTNLSELALRPYTLITYFFSHDAPNPTHIFYNMIGLYWFGTIVQDLIGTKKLLGLYIIGGLASGLSVLVIANVFPNFVSPNTYLVGASGSVFAISVAAATLAPTYMFNMLFLGPIKIVWIVGAYIFLSFIGLAGSNVGGEVAHLTGAILGYFFIIQLRNGNDWSRFLDWRPFSRRPKLKVSRNNSLTKSDPDYVPNQAELDAILDKISKSGYDSLSKEEKQSLFNASKK